MSLNEIRRSCYNCKFSRNVTILCVVLATKWRNKKKMKTDDRIPEFFTDFMNYTRLSIPRYTVKYNLGDFMNEILCFRPFGLNHIHLTCKYWIELLWFFFCLFRFCEWGTRFMTIICIFYPAEPMNLPFIILKFIDVCMRHEIYDHWHKSDLFSP